MRAPLRKLSGKQELMGIATLSGMVLGIALR